MTRKALVSFHDIIESVGQTELALKDESYAFQVAFGRRPPVTLINDAVTIAPALIIGL